MRPLLLAVLLGTGPPALHHRIVVEPGTAVPTVGSALALAHDGDTIVVHAGTYREGNLSVTRRVSLRGEGGPVLDGEGRQVFTVTADSVAITGLTIRNVASLATEDRAGIKVINARGCRIEDNTLLDTFFGIYLSRATGCVIRRNRVKGRSTTEASAGNAIHSWSSDSLLIEENAVEGHRDGIYLEFTSHSTIRRNRSGRMLRYGLHFMFSNDNRYERNLFEGNRAGVAVMYSRQVTMRDNLFARSWGSGAYGLLLKDITEARLEHNRFQGNTVGIWAEGTTRVIAADNEFRNNGWAVRVMADAVATEFRHNRFEGNSFDVATNSVNATTRFTENYWDRYAGYDLDHDGYGDVPFAPVRLFSLIVQQNEPALILQRSLLVSLLDLAERVAPVLTPATMEDSLPLMRWPRPALTDR
jgi:nitrous oxidase accessory protein